MNNNKDYVSAIVPVYNSLNYLEKCLDSIIKQTFENLQIIIIDDGSDDGSSVMCDEYAQKDDRIEVVHKLNGGLVSARQQGILRAKGEWIINLDSDDWIEHDYIENLYQAAIKNNVDMVAADLFFDVGDSSRIINNCFPVGIYSPRDLENRLIYSGKFFEYGIQPHLVTKFVKRDKILTFQMDVDRRIVIGEDAAVCYPCLLNCESILISDICGYHYVQHTKSMTKASSKNYSFEIDTLIRYMNKKLQFSNNLILMNQIILYERYLKLLHNIQSFDDMVLLPYGGIKKGNRIVIYGAGGLGQQINQYVDKTNNFVLVKWVDQNFNEYKSQGLNVESPEILKGRDDIYDYVLIANISADIAGEIKKYLMFDIGVREDKVRWLSMEFIFNEIKR